MAGLASSLSAAVLILCGAINALLSKVVYQLEGQDCSGATKPFQKPWLQTAAMFVAMAFCLPIAWGLEYWQARTHRKPHINRPGAAAADTAPAAPDATHASSRKGGRDGDAGPDGDSLRQALLTNADGGNDQQQDPQQQDQQQRQGGRFTASKVFSEALMLCIPTGFDLAATTLMNVGLLYVAASVFQILRGAEMLFAALFAVLFLKRHLNKWHFMGVAACMAGISLVGVSRVLAGGDSGGTADSILLQGPRVTPLGVAAVTPLSGTAGVSGGAAAAGGGWISEGGAGGDAGGGGAGPADPKQAVLGMCLIVLSQAIQAGQVTVEDHFMSEMHMHPLKVVGYEGLIGSIVMLGGALPLLQHLPFQDGSGLAEDTWGSWCMVRSSPTITIVLLLSSLAVLVYNISGMYVTEQVGAAARTVLENARTLLVWLAALALFYTHAGGGKVGEPWDSWSWLQAVGFAVFATGAFLYDKGHKQEEEQTIQAGRVPKYSKWAVLKSTLGIHTGHFVGVRKFRVAGDAVLAGVRAGRLAEERRNGGGGEGRLEV